MSSRARSDRTCRDDEDSSYENEDEGVQVADDIDDGDWADEDGEPELSKSGRKKRKPPKEPRTLHSWGPSRDQLLLLTIEYICSKNDITIPWNDVAKIMSPYLTGEAVKQHLTKLWGARVDHGFQVPPRHNKATSRPEAKMQYDPKEPSAPVEGKDRAYLLCFSSKSKASSGGGKQAASSKQKTNFTASEIVSSTPRKTSAQGNTTSTNSGPSRGRGRKARAELIGTNVTEDALITPSSKRSRLKKQKIPSSSSTKGFEAENESDFDSPSKKQKRSGRESSTKKHASRTKGRVDYREQAEQPEFDEEIVRSSQDVGVGKVESLIDAAGYDGTGSMQAKNMLVTFPFNSNFQPGIQSSAEPIAAFPVHTQGNGVNPEFNNTGDHPWAGGHFQFPGTGAGHHQWLTPEQYNASNNASNLGQTTNHNGLPAQSIYPRTSFGSGAGHIGMINSSESLITPANHPSGLRCHPAHLEPGHPPVGPGFGHLCRNASSANLAGLNPYPGSQYNIDMNDSVYAAPQNNVNMNGNTFTGAHNHVNTNGYTFPDPSSASNTDANTGSVASNGTHGDVDGNANGYHRNNNPHPSSTPAFVFSYAHITPNGEITRAINGMNREGEVVYPGTSFSAPGTMAPRDMVMDASSFSDMLHTDTNNYGADASANNPSYSHHAGAGTPHDAPVYSQPSEPAFSQNHSAGSDPYDAGLDPSTLDQIYFTPYDESLYDNGNG